MKKLRKTMALLVVMVMALSLMPQMVLAAQTDNAYMYGWYVSGPEQGDNIKAYIDGNDAVSGTNSLYIQKDDQNWVDFSVDQKLLIPAGEYTLSLWVKGGYEDATTVLFEDGHWQTHKLLNGEYTTGTEFSSTEGENGWKKLEKTLTFDNTTKKIRILTVGWASGFYVDDISLVKKGTTNNIIKNGSFEIKAPTYTTELEDYYQGWGNWSAAALDNENVFYCVTDNIAHSGNNSVVLRHVDGSQSYKNVCIAQSELSLEAGTYTLSFWAVGTRTDIDMQGVTLADPWKKYSMHNRQPVETDGDWSKYEIEVTMEGTETAMTFTTDGDTEGWYIDDISLVKKGTTNNRIINGSFDVEKTAKYTTELEAYYQGWGNWSAATLDNENVFYCVTDNIAHSGNNSVVIKHADPSQNWRAVTLVQEGLSYGAGTYTFSFWVAGSYAKNLCGMTTNGDWWDDFYLNDFTVAEKDGDWTKYTINFTVPEGKTQNAITLMSNGDTQSLYLDDISLVKAGTTENLLINESFDDDGKPDYKTNLSDYFYGWSDWSAVERDGNLVFLCVTDEIAHSGNNSFVLRHVDSSKTSNISVAQNIPSLETGSYTLSFWAAGTKNGSLQGVTLADPWRKYSVSNFQVTGTEGIWSKYEMTVTASGGETAITFFTDGDTNGWFIDDISLVKAGTTNNIIVNGSFDDDGIPDYTTAFEDYFKGWEKEYSVTENGSSIFSCVTNEMAHSGSNSVILRHVDESQYDRDLMIKQTGLSLGEGTYTLSFWATGTVADWDDDTYRYQHIVWLEGLDPSYRYVTDMTTGTIDGDWRYYTLDFTVPSGSTVSAIKLSTRGHGTEFLYVDDFNLVKAGTTQNLLKNGGFEYKALDGYYVSTPKVMKIEGESKRELEALESGKLEVSLEVTNYTMGDDFAPVMLLVLYDGKTVKQVEYVQQSSQNSTLEGFLEDEFCHTIDVPEMTEGTEYKIEVLCWKSLASLKPLMNALELK